jgi:glycerophosphoryl diester phosphodiesterase
MLDRAAFLRPMAHRGLHDRARGIIENTASAFDAAIGNGYGIECDLRPAADGTPMVFHDLVLARLVDAPGQVTDHSAVALSRLTYRGASSERIISFADFLDLVAGRVPLLVEIKSEWTPPDPAFLQTIASQATAYRGPLALMSFDPAVMAALKTLAPTIPRGIVAGLYEGPGWWLDKLGKERAFRLSHLLESGPAEPQFFSYDVKALPTPVTRFAREVLHIPLFTWTVRTPQERTVAAQWADAITFEGFEP